MTKNLTRKKNDAILYETKGATMISLMLVLGILSIFSSGVLAHMHHTKGDLRDFYISAIGFASGVFILVSMIGAIA